MRKSALILAAALAVCFTFTGAEAAKKKRQAAAKPPASASDAAYQWNLKNIPPMAAPGATAAGQTAAKPKGKKAKKAKKSS
jgi:hypothetical protein